ncbi:outer membrane protein assembly factor BamE [Comamonas nitrativorans]|uniref:Outer membrane protein assembly factor BamE n=1 Tax=Comamonas nitrativorans TaxID=108437 RepID=A0ABV9H091_9BURK|nr:outer membrane protein assembly factor BamE [Comamonas sp.]
MSAQARCRAALALILPFALAACGNMGDASRSAMHKITPYKVDVVQGNFVSKEQVQALQPGMSRQQVREILGSPLLTSVFHADRWEYVFTMKRKGVPEQTRKLAVFFHGDAFDRAEGDEMPSEEEFIASLSKPKGKLKIPQLEATPEQLAKYPARHDTQDAAGSTVTSAPAVQRSYPPLERD